MDKLSETFLEYEQKLKSLTKPTAPSLSEGDQRVLTEYNDLKSKSARLRLVGEDAEADKLIKDILRLQGLAEEIKKKLDVQPTAKESVLEACRETPESELYQLAAKIQQLGLKAHGETEKEIERLSEEVRKAKYAYLELLSELNSAWHRKFNIFVKAKKAEKALPEEMHQVPMPPQAPKWGEFAISEAELAKSYGARPSRAFLHNI